MVPERASTQAVKERPRSPTRIVAGAQTRIEGAQTRFLAESTKLEAFVKRNGNGKGPLLKRRK